MLLLAEFCGVECVDGSSQDLRVELLNKAKHPCDAFAVFFLQEFVQWLQHAVFQILFAFWRHLSIQKRSPPVKLVLEPRVVETFETFYVESIFTEPCLGKRRVMQLIVLIPITTQPNMKKKKNNKHKNNNKHNQKQQYSKQ